MKLIKEKEVIKKILEEDMVELDDSGFSRHIVTIYIEQKEKERFKLFWNNDLIYAISFVVLGLISLSLWFKEELSVFFNQLNISLDHLILITMIFFIFLIFRFFSEFFVIKATLPNKRQN